MKKLIIRWLGLEAHVTRASIAQLEQRIRSVEIELTRVPPPEKKKSHAEINAEIMAALERVDLTEEEKADWAAGM